MQLPTLVVIIALEIALALLVLCLLLYFYSRKIRQLMGKQQEQLRLAMAKNAAPSEPPQPPPEPEADAEQALRQQLALTLAVFQREAPDTDIDQIDTPLPTDMARLAALRYALLSAELGAEGHPEWSEEDWEALDKKLQPLMSSPPDAETQSGEDLTQALANAQKRIDNLERFKKLFFEMESKWETARSDAQDYHDQLAQMTDGVEDQEKFEEVLAKYHAVYDDVNETLAEAGAAPRAAAEPGGQNETITLTRPDPRTAEQLNTLRNVAADQHRIINKLQKQLEQAHSAEEKEVVIEQLQGQLERQERYVKESETCVQLLESELETAMNKLNEFEVKASDNTDNLEEMEEMRATLNQFTMETKDLLTHLDKLEKENSSLKGSTGAGALSEQEQGVELKALKEKYTMLEAQYADLEEKYLALRSQ